MDEAAISNVARESNHVRVQVLSPGGVLDRDKQLGALLERQTWSLPPPATASGVNAFLASPATATIS
jgi:hypothetical protein